MTSSAALYTHDLPIFHMITYSRIPLFAYPFNRLHVLNIMCPLTGDEVHPMPPGVHLPWIWAGRSGHLPTRLRVF